MSDESTEQTGEITCGQEEVYSQSQVEYSPSQQYISTPPTKKSKSNTTDLFRFFKKQPQTVLEGSTVKAAPMGLSFISNHRDVEDLQVQVVDPPPSPSREENTESLSTPNSVTPQAKKSTDRFTTVQLQARTAKFCNNCGCVDIFCHELMYGKFCLKFVYSYLHNNFRGKDGSIEWCAVCPDMIETVYRRGYNEYRRGDLDGRFSYLCPNLMELPRCMRNNSLHDALTLEYNPVLVAKIKADNEKGYQNYLTAKANYLA